MSILFDIGKTGVQITSAYPRRTKSYVFWMMKAIDPGWVRGIPRHAALAHRLRLCPALTPA
jgi:hypothetical protein